MPEVQKVSITTMKPGQLPDDPDYHLNKWRHAMLDQRLKSLAEQKRMPKLKISPEKRKKAQSKKIELHRRKA